MVLELFLAPLRSIGLLWLKEGFKAVSRLRIIHFLPRDLCRIVLYSFLSFFSWIVLLCLSILLHYARFWLPLFWVSFLFIILSVSWLRLIDLHFKFIILSDN